MKLRRVAGLFFGFLTILFMAISDLVTMSLASNPPELGLGAIILAPLFVAIPFLIQMLSALLGLTSTVLLRSSRVVGSIFLILGLLGVISWIGMTVSFRMPATSIVLMLPSLGVSFEGIYLAKHKVKPQPPP